MQVIGSFDAGDSGYHFVCSPDVLPAMQSGIHYVGEIIGNPNSGNPFYINGLINLPGDGPQTMIGYLNFGANSSSMVTCKPGVFKAEVDTSNVSLKFEVAPLGTNNSGFDLQDNSTLQTTSLKLGLNGIDFRIANYASSEMQEEQWNHLDWNHRIYDPAIPYNSYLRYLNTGYTTFFHDSTNHFQNSNGTSAYGFGGVFNNLNNGTNTNFMFDSSFSFISYRTDFYGSLKVGSHQNLWRLNQYSTGNFTSVELQDNYLELDATDNANGTQTTLKLSNDGTAVFDGGASPMSLGINYSNPTEALVVNGNGLIFGNGIFEDGASVGTTSAPTSTLTVNGSFSAATTAVGSSTYTVGSTDYCLFINYSNPTITLPSASTCAGRIYIFKDLIGAGYSIVPNGSETIDNVSGTYNATGNVQLISYSGNWYIIN